MNYLLGLDAGGTKTVCILTDEDGHVNGVGLSGCGNYQVCGRDSAKKELAKAIQASIRDAAVDPGKIAVAFYGISGADREEDFGVIRQLLEPVNPARRMDLENDTTIALRAGTKDGVGLGLISGTGTNAIGFNRKGERLQVGGWGSPYLGDFGSSHDIAAMAFGLAQRGRDGRGRPTLLYEKLCTVLNVRQLVDICEWDFAESPRHLDVARFTPLVFEAAAEGDPVATEILEHTGREISLAALAVLRTLFEPGEEIPVVLGGSVFQKAEHPAMVQALERAIRREFPLVRFQVLDKDPVIGALLAAADRHFDLLPNHFPETLVTSYNQRRVSSSHPA